MSKSGHGTGTVPQDEGKLYQPSVETIRETFAVLIGFAATEFIKEQFTVGAGDWPTRVSHWALSFAFLWLLLRLFVGSANHLKTEYTEVDCQKSDFNFGTTSFNLIKDVLFLILFGVLSIWISRSEAPVTFLRRAIGLLAITSGWALLDGLIDRWIKRAKAKPWWLWWLMLDPFQLLITQLIWILQTRCTWWMPSVWDSITMTTLAVVYAGFFVVDVYKILQICHRKTAAALPFWFLYVGLGELALAGVLYWRFMHVTH